MRYALAPRVDVKRLDGDARLAQSPSPHALTGPDLDEAAGVLLDQGHRFSGAGG